MKSWERLEQIINWSGLTVNAFALSLGLKRGENLYQIKKGRNSISKDLAELITKKYCTISKSWLLTGEGSMFSAVAGEAGTVFGDRTKIPFYVNLLPSADQAGMLSFPTMLSEVVIPFLPECDFSVVWSGDSMVPDIPSGAVVFLKETAIADFFPGEMYLIYTESYATIRRVRLSEQDGSAFRLTASNQAFYPEAVINRSAVRRLFLVRGLFLIRSS
jgi:hypothetical protein